MALYEGLDEIQRLVVSLDNKLTLHDACPIWGVAQADDLGFNDSILHVKVSQYFSFFLSPFGAPLLFSFFFFCFSNREDARQHTFLRQSWACTSIFLRPNPHPLRTPPFLLHAPMHPPHGRTRYALASYLLQGNLQQR